MEMMGMGYGYNSQSDRGTHYSCNVRPVSALTETESNQHRIRADVPRSSVCATPQQPKAPQAHLTRHA